MKVFQLRRPDCPLDIDLVARWRRMLLKTEKIPDSQLNVIYEQVALLAVWAHSFPGGADWIYGEADSVALPKNFTPEKRKALTEYALEFIRGYVEKNNGQVPGKTAIANSLVGVQSAVQYKVAAAALAMFRDDPIRKASPPLVPPPWRLDARPFAPTS